MSILFKIGIDRLFKSAFLTSGFVGTCSPVVELCADRRIGTVELVDAVYNFLLKLTNQPTNSM